MVCIFELPKFAFMKNIYTYVVLLSILIPLKIFLSSGCCDSSGPTMTNAWVVIPQADPGSTINVDPSCNPDNGYGGINPIPGLISSGTFNIRVTIKCSSGSWGGNSYLFLQNGGSIKVKQNGGSCGTPPSISGDRILLSVPSSDHFTVTIEMFACGGCEGSYNAVGWSTTYTVTQSISNGATIQTNNDLIPNYSSNATCPLFIC